MSALRAGCFDMGKPEAMLEAQVADDSSVYWCCFYQNVKVAESQLQEDDASLTALAKRFNLFISIICPPQWVQTVSIHLPAGIIQPVPISTVFSWVKTGLHEQHHISALSCFWDIDYQTDPLVWTVWVIPKSRLEGIMSTFKAQGVLSLISTEALRDTVNLYPWRDRIIRQRLYRYGSRLLIAMVASFAAAMIIMIIMYGQPSRWRQKVGLAKSEFVLLRGLANQQHQQVLQQDKAITQHGRSQNEIGQLASLMCYIAIHRQPGIALDSWSVEPPRWLLSVKFGRMSQLQNWLIVLRQAPGVVSVKLVNTQRLKQYSRAKVVLSVGEQ